MFIGYTHPRSPGSDASNRLWYNMDVFFLMYEVHNPPINPNAGTLTLPYVGHFASSQPSNGLLRISQQCRDAYLIWTVQNSLPHTLDLLNQVVVDFRACFVSVARPVHRCVYLVLVALSLAAAQVDLSTQ